MRVVIQRVRKASVLINATEKRVISQGLVVLLGIEMSDTEEDVLWMVNKTLNLRIFGDENDVMNRSLLDIEGELLVVSQFTLMASTKKGNRPSYIRAATHEHAIPLYESFLAVARERMEQAVVSGTFGAAMQIDLVNDGPVTIVIDSKNKE
ncbi:MAG: D-tyrosyl-tRNA(Tyr) deacylase [Flavobacteriaceae bacterium]|jgi:D-aminoacyl-tRNA deacylase|nr:D-tyrosyl-tRNA(Tyr) deacylase [Flavobacteriaceae bacterium]MDA8900395.1 D-aminoacyl-tRNA deacylase [Flavobacteriaceae bacterium]